MHEFSSRPRQIELAFTELRDQYPFAAEWLADPENTVGQFDVSGKRLRLAEEKIALFGGKEQIQQTHADAIGRGDAKPLILQACRQGGMVLPEIHHFFSEIDVPISQVMLRWNLFQMTVLGKQERNKRIMLVPGMLYVVRKPFAPDAFTVNENQTGYDTTSSGMKLAVDDRLSKRGNIFDGRWAPKPI